MFPFNNIYSRKVDNLYYSEICVTERVKKGAYGKRTTNFKNLQTYETNQHKKGDLGILFCSEKLQ